jgi:hypothetical protein
MAAAPPAKLKLRLAEMASSTLANNVTTKTEPRAMDAMV